MKIIQLLASLSSTGSGNRDARITPPTQLNSDAMRHAIVVHLPASGSERSKGNRFYNLSDILLNNNYPK